MVANLVIEEVSHAVAEYDGSPRCPLCQTVLAWTNLVRVIPAHVRERRQGYGVAREQVDEQRIKTPILRCRECDWMVQRAGGLLYRTEPPIPERCFVKHQYSWSGRRIGGRIDLKCAGFYNGDKPCPAKQSVWYRKQGFVVNGRNADGETKRLVYGVLTHYREVGGAAINAIVAGTGLTSAQVAGCLKAGVKYHYVEHTPEKVPLIPRGRGYLYALTQRGEDWVAWAHSKGLYS